MNATKNITDYEIEYERNNTVDTEVVKGEMEEIKEVALSVQTAMNTVLVYGGP